LVDIKKQFNEAGNTARIEDFRCYDLRPTAATRMADGNANVIVIAEIPGHSDIRTTKRYSHAMEEAKREAVEKLAKPATLRQKSVKRKSKEKRQGARPAVNC
jgi:integrase